MSIWLCNTCACGVCNDDWSALDYHYVGDEATREYTFRTERLETLGWLTPTWATQDANGERCAVCDGKQWETMTEFEVSQ